MSKHKKFEEIKGIKEQELYLSKLIKVQHDKELRNKWESIVEKSPPQSIDRSSQSPFLKLFFTICLLAALTFLTIKFMPSKDLDPKHFALQELSQAINHPGITKGISSDVHKRTSAIIKFNNQDFDQAILDFEKIQAATLEDNFYLGMAHFYSKEYNQAAALLTPISNTESVLTEEAKWYLSLTHILNDSPEKAISLLEQIRPNQWKYGDAQQLIKSIGINN